jgi:hypothetical protein
MRLLVLSLPLIAVACSTPREVCISDANRELNIMNALVAETRGNLARGYALRTVETSYLVDSTCYRRDDSGEVKSYVCQETAIDTRQEPEAIDLNAEKAKLASLEERQAQMQANARAVVQQCIAAHPE